MPSLLNIGRRAGEALGASLFTAAGQTFVGSAAGLATVGYPATVLVGAGQQTQQTITTSPVSLLDSTLTIPARFTAGDLLRIEIVTSAVQNSGAGRTWTPLLKFGSTTVHTTSVSPGTSASTRIMHSVYLIRLTSTSAQRTHAAISYNAWTANGSASEITTSSIDMTSAVALDYTLVTSNATVTQTAQVDQISVVHIPLKTA